MAILLPGRMWAPKASPALLMAICFGIFSLQAYNKLVTGFAEASAIDDSLDSPVQKCYMYALWHKIIPGKDVSVLPSDLLAHWKLHNCDQFIKGITEQWQTAGGGHFRDLSISLPIAPALVKASDGGGQGSKYFVGPRAVEDFGKSFIIYSAGNAGIPDFELDMAARGAQVFSFDCTVRETKPEWSNFTFYSWCIGTKHSMESNIYSAASGKTEEEYKFYSLSEIKKTLGHKHIDMLKIDIEGFEWNLLRDEIIDAKEEDLPEQLLVELHTEGVSPVYVPRDLVAGKSRKAVTKLVLDLYKRNYRLINMELNNGDHFCMELAFVRFPSV